ncbi:thiamine-phosphate kinase [Actinomyces viscosus]|uniref:Thiamine-monophosphate kinase n=1 Tax=Actinomyces viscosus TaxID=1656 RepID=A0A3S4VI21_ACTVI|nr:thiamine-phosphate kinase [Actinomyces viscosus]TFH53510.1 thiamine-phosphate kinase [Actinomyces viscosus]VEI14534.1 Thiamine-monophosphate kinase [Actinomyces viscosus]
MSTAEPVPPGGQIERVGDLSEEEILAVITPLLPRAVQTPVGTGDDCAVLSFPDTRTAVSTDVLVEGHHFRTEWSTGRDVGVRAAAQNLADAAAMGARPVALVVGLVMPPATPVAWVRDFAQGLAQGCEPCGAGVVGGDLSSGESLVVAVTVLGDLEGRAPVLRSGARPGDLVVHAGTLGRSAAGLALLSAGPQVVAAVERGGGPVQARDCLAAFRAPVPALAAGPALADAGATSMMDVSDGLLRDAGRIARASSVVIDLDDPDDLPDMSFLEPVAALMTEGEGASARTLARSWLLTGGEDHGMLATVPAAAVGSLPADARVIGRVLAPGAPQARALDHRPGVLLKGEPARERAGWDHFSRA